MADQKEAVPWVWPLGKEYPVAVSTLSDLMPGSPIGLLALKISFIAPFTNTLVKEAYAIYSAIFLLNDQ